MNEHATRALLPALLRALSNGEPRLADGADSADIERLVESGLGPLLHRLRPANGFKAEPGSEALLHGADLTSRVLTSDLFAAIEEIVIALRSTGLEPTLLKGIAYASRYYPEPHLRMMGDVDVLVPAGAINDSVGTLRGLGYVTVEDRGQSLHHAPPLRHPERKVYVELHHALLPSTSAAARDAPFDTASIDNETRESPFGSTTARFLSPELDLMLIAAGWCRDVAGRLGLRITPRPLVDAVVLIDSCDVDWDRVANWSRDSFAGACLAILLTWLERHDAWRGPATLTATLVERQPFVNGTSLRTIHAIFDRHVARGRRPGRFLSLDVLETVLDSLIAPRPAWQNIAHVPLNVAFPRREPRRFRPGFVVRRLSAPCRPR
jgi:hypothetical protein